MGEKDVASYLACVVGGLAALHERGWVYRDIKAENLIFTQAGTLKLVDFGLAKWLGAGGRTSTVCGTTEYMAPEVVEQNAYDRSADWWAVGCVGYECAFGCTPWRLGDDGEPNYGLTDTKITKHIVDERRPLAFPVQEPPPSEPFRALLTGLLTRTPARRLGGTNAGCAAVRDAPFFGSVDWGALDAGTLPMPPMPTITRRSSRRTREFTEEHDDDDDDDDEDDDEEESDGGPPVDALSAQLLAFAQKQREGADATPPEASAITSPPCFPSPLPHHLPTHSLTAQHPFFPPPPAGAARLPARRGRQAGARVRRHAACALRVAEQHGAMPTPEPLAHHPRAHFHRTC